MYHVTAWQCCSVWLKKRDANTKRNEYAIKRRRDLERRNRAKKRNARQNAMNKVILMGRLTRDPEVRYSQGENAMAIARFTLAVDRRFRREEASTDFIGCVALGKNAEFIEKYFRQGMKVLVTGRIQTGSYTKRDGQKVYTTDVVVEEQEFAESKNSAGSTAPAASGVPMGETGDGFMNIPDGIDEELPFN